MNTGWTDSHDNALRDAINEGCTFLQAAKVLNDLFKTEYSRNATVSRARRIGVLSRNKPKNGSRRAEFHTPPQPPAPKPPAAKPGPVPRPVSRVPPAPRALACEPVIDLRTADVVPRHISIYELTDETCKWPYGDCPPLTYCGCQVFADGPYCEPHDAIARRSA